MHAPHRHRSYGFAGALAALLMLGAGQAASGQPLPSGGDAHPSLAPLVKQVAPAVVNVSVTSSAPAASNPQFDDPFFRRFFDIPDRARSEPRHSVGSGVIIDAARGYVVTNHHVIDNADELTVTLQDGEDYDATLIGSDAGTDIALLKIDAHGLSALELGDSHGLEVGDYVIAIGNPFGLGQTVTSGIVSALGRSGLSIEGYEDFIQTDASINPGNSGGALIDLEGRLVGINTAIVSPAGGNVGIGFAVPAHMVQAVLDQLLEYGEVRRGRLGIVIQDLTPELASALHVDASGGAMVTEVERGSAAQAAGLEAGDVVTAVNGQAVSGATQLRNAIGLLPVGEKVALTVLREGRSRTFGATVGPAQAAPLGGERIAPALRGAVLQDYEAGQAPRDDVQGVLVVSVVPASPAYRNGLRKDDVITSVNRQAVSSVADLTGRLAGIESTVALGVRRGGMNMFLILN